MPSPMSDQSTIILANRSGYIHHKPPEVPRIYRIQSTVFPTQEWVESSVKVNCVVYLAKIMNKETAEVLRLASN
ncbi:hypothetical protein CBS147320_2309 [Aspergillus niger]|nr:hypothetical protein CBS11852_163 [Aspergillus niger]KAI2932110.1 hypothetical protein CBS147320_2309 [Aspergillus niger]KAI3083300.1 hypothetical protein CBS147353_2324 [Aspergillus niger]